MLKIPQYQILDKTIEKLSKIPGDILDKIKEQHGIFFYTDIDYMNTLELTEQESDKYREKILQQSTNRQKIPETLRMYRIRKNRNAKIKDYSYKTARYILNYCKDNNIGTIIVGYNPGWKQSVNLGKKFNQNFTMIPFKTYFLHAIENGADLFGMNYKEVEESHTSKCSFLDYEEIKHHEKYKGKRPKRGQYISTQKHKINADCNAAGNITIRGGGDLPKLREQYRTLLAKPKRINLFAQM